MRLWQSRRPEIGWENRVTVINMDKANLCEPADTAMLDPNETKRINESGSYSVENGLSKRKLLYRG